MLYTILLIIFLILLAIAWWVYNTEPKLPTNINALIREVKNNPIPEFIKGETHRVSNKGLSIFYEKIDPTSPAKGTIILVNGLGQTLLDWHDYFYEPLVEAGYQVIRFDNRGLGESDWVKDWNRKERRTFNLSDMASDIIAIQTDLGLKQTHIIGMSMGGMIAQTLAIEHPERVQTLTSIMSTGFYWDPDLVNIPSSFQRQYAKIMIRHARTIQQLETKLKFQWSIRKILKGKGDYQLDDKGILQQAYYEIKRRKSFNPKVSDIHGYAIKSSGSRYEGLRQLNMPVTVIHGTDDTLVDFSHAKKYAPLIPNAQSVFIEGMGHDLPKAYTPQMITAILKMIDV